MKITNNRIDGVPFVKTPNMSGTLNPKLIVMHYTAGYTAESAINTLTNPKSKASAHVVVDLDGTITQLVDFNRVAWHAGPSKHGKYNGLNNHSIGIEIVNIGFLKKLVSGHYLDAEGRRVDISRFEDLVEAAHPIVGSGTFYWPTYPRKQLEAVVELTRALIETYGIEDIVSHEEIDTRGWKTDPGPAFPMKTFTKLLEKDDRNINSVNSNAYVVTVDTLNVRKRPSIGGAIVTKLNLNTEVNVISFKGEWARIGTDEWVHAKYIKKVSYNL